MDKGLKINYSIIEGDEASKVVKEKLANIGTISIYHTIEKLYTDLGFKLVVFEESNNTLLAIPLRFAKLWKLIKVVTSYYPSIPFIGPIYTHNYIHSKISRKYEIINSVTRIILRNLKADLVYLTLHPEHNDVRPFMWSGWHTRVTYTYVLNDLSKYENIEKVLKFLRKRRRNEYRSAVKAGVEFSQTTLSKISDQAIKMLESLFLAKGQSRKDVDRIISAIKKLCNDIDKISVTYVALLKGRILGFETFVVDHYRGLAIRQYAAYRRGIIRGTSTFLLIQSLHNIYNTMGDSINKVLLLAAPVRQLAEFMDDFADEVYPYFTVYCGKGLFNKLIKIKTPPFHKI